MCGLRRGLTVCNRATRVSVFNSFCTIMEQNTEMNRALATQVILVSGMNSLLVLVISKDLLKLRKIQNVTSLILQEILILEQPHH